MSAPDRQAPPSAATAPTRERWGFEAVFDGGGLAVAVAIGRDRSVGRGWYRAVVTGAGRRPVVVADPDVALPARPGSLEFRAPGLWCDHAPDQPLPAWPSVAPDPSAAPVELPHWTVAAEAFGIAVEDRWEVWGRGFGDRTAVGLDLGFDAVTLAQGGTRRAGPGPHPEGDPAPWEVVGCQVVGEVLVADERLEVAGPGVLTYDCGSAVVPPRGSWRRWWVEGPGRWATAVGGDAVGVHDGDGNVVGVIDGPAGRVALSFDAGTTAAGGWVTRRPADEGHPQPPRR